MIDETKTVAEQAAQPQQQLKDSTKGHVSPFKEEITIEDFMKIDLRVATVITAESVEGADKLLKLKLDVGGVERQVFAGIKSSYDPESLIDRQVVFVANLKPRKMRFGLSEGMVIAAGGERLYLVSPDDGASAGAEVK